MQRQEMKPGTVAVDQTPRLEARRKRRRRHISSATRLAPALLVLLSCGCESPEEKYRKLPDLYSKVFVAARSGSADVIEITNVGEAALPRISVGYVAPSLEDSQHFALAPSQTVTVSAPRPAETKSLLLFCPRFQLATFEITRESDGSVRIAPDNEGDRIAASIHRAARERWWRLCLFWSACSLVGLWLLGCAYSLLKRRLATQPQRDVEGASDAS